MISALQTDLLDRNLITLSTILILLALCGIIFNYSFRYLEKSQYGKRFRHFLRRIYRQMMAAGLISFAILIAKETGLLALFSTMDKSASEADLTEIYSFSFMLLFLALLMGVCIVFTLSALLSAALNVWKAYEVSYKRTLANMQSRASHNWPTITASQSRCGNLKTINVLSYISNGLQSMIRRAAGDSEEFGTVREVFIMQNMAGSSFPMHDYLSRCADSSLVELVDVHISIWAIMCACIVANAVRLYICREANAACGDLDLSDGLLPLSIFNALTTVATTATAYIVRRAFRKLIDNYKRQNLHQAFGPRTPRALRGHRKIRRRVTFADDPNPLARRERRTSVTDLQEHEANVQTAAPRRNRAAHARRQSLHMQAMTAFVHNDVFPWKRPSIILRILEALLLLHSISFSLLIAVFGNRIVNMDPEHELGMHIVLSVASSALPLVSILFIFPSILPSFILVTNVGYLTNREQLEKTLENTAESKMKRKLARQENTARVLRSSTIFPEPNSSPASRLPHV